MDRSFKNGSLFEYAVLFIGRIVVPVDDTRQITRKCEDMATRRRKNDVECT